MSFTINYKLELIILKCEKRKHTHLLKLMNTSEKILDLATFCHCIVLQSVVSCVFYLKKEPFIFFNISLFSTSLCQSPSNSIKKVHGVLNYIFVCCK